MYWFFLLSLISFLLPFSHFYLQVWWEKIKKDKESEEKQKDLDKKGEQDFEHYNKQIKKNPEK